MQCSRLAFSSRLSLLIGALLVPTSGLDIELTAIVHRRHTSNSSLLTSRVSLIDFLPATSQAAETP